MNPIIPFDHADISLKIILAIGVGLIVGLEREFSSKDVGLRSFSLTALFGLLSQLINVTFTIYGFFGILFLTLYMNVRSILVNRNLEITTSLALLITYCLGILIAQGHVFTPVTGAIIITMLLAWKNELSAFAHGIQFEEIRSTIILGLITLVIYPILPDRTVDPWQYFNPREAWITVIAIASMSFINYVLLKVYSTKGLYYSALLGGAINSKAAVSEIARAVKIPFNGGVLPRSLPILLMTNVAMFVRNLTVLGICEPQSIVIALFPLLGMTLTAIFFIWRARYLKEEGVSPVRPSILAFPISISRVLKFGVIFVILQSLGILAERRLGSFGVLLVSGFGGMINSSSTTAAAAKLASQGKITANIAGIATILASISSAFVNLPLVYQITKDRILTQKLGITTFICILSGLILMLWTSSIKNFF